MVVSSPAIANNVVYVGSYNHIVYAFGSVGSSHSKQTSSMQPELLVLLIFVPIAVVVIALAIVIYRKRSKVIRRER